MILTKHNRAKYFLTLCLTLPITTSMLIMLFMHNQQLKAKYSTFSTKFFYLSFKEQFSFEYILYLLIIVIIPCIIIYVLIDYFFYVDFDIKPFMRHLRGVKMASINYLKFMTKSKKDNQLLICNVPIPKKVENLHFMIAGSTGTGKSTILNELIASAIQRKDRVIIIDPNGGFLSKFYQIQDKILNPFDKRSEIWDAFFDIKNDNYDFEQIAYSMIPPQNNSSGEEWNGYARTLLRGLMKACKKNSIYTIHYIIDLLNTATNDELKEFVTGTEAQSLFAIAEGSNNNNTINSTRFVLAKYIASYQYLPKNSGFGFSIRDYINHEKGNLFITWREDMVQALKPLISTWCDIVASSILSADNKQNILFVIDELDTLNQLPSLEHLATKGRKHGLNIVACIQSTAQLDATYGKDKAIALRSCFRNLIVLGGSKTDDKTANDLSSALGEHEVIRLDKSQSYTNNTKKQLAFKERIVLPSEIQSLPQLQGYLAFALDYPVAKFKIDRVEYLQRAKSFV